jgi:hypothetical protein
MTDRPITRIVTAEQALGIVRGPIVGADQRTLVDAQPPEMPPGPPLHALPIPCTAAGPRTVLDGVPPSLVQHTAQALYGTHTPPGDAQRLRPDQATMFDGVPAAIAPPPATRAPTHPTLVTVHSALGHPVRDARILAPNQVTEGNGVPAPVHDEPPTLRLSARPPAPPSAPLATVRHPSAPPTMPRARAILFVVLACAGSALVTGGLVHALHDRQHRAATVPAAPAAQPPPEPTRDAVLRSRR